MEVQHFSRLMAMFMGQVDSKHSEELSYANADFYDRGVFADSKLGFVLYYHYADRSGAIGDGAKKFGWNASTWSNGWPVV